MGLPRWHSGERVCLPMQEMQEMQEIQVQSLGWEDPLEKEMATHSSILAWKTPWTEWVPMDCSGLQSIRLQRVRHNWVQTPTTPCSLDGKEFACSAEDLGSIPGSGRSPGEGNSNPLQYSCLENPMDRGVWWATVHGVTNSQTQLSY